MCVLLCFFFCKVGKTVDTPEGTDPFRLASKVAKVVPQISETCIKSWDMI